MASTLADLDKMYATPAPAEAMTLADLDSQYGSPDGLRGTTVPESAKSGPVSDAVDSIDTAGAAAIGSRLNKQMATGRKQFAPMAPDELAQRADDIARLGAQGATFNYSDEIIARVRSTLGDDYAEALKAEREGIKQSKDRLGSGGATAAEVVGGFLTAGPVAKSIQFLGGVGHGALQTLRQGAAGGVVGAVTSTVAGSGAREDNNIVEATKTGAPIGFGLGFGAPVVIKTVGSFGRAVGNVKDIAHGMMRPSNAPATERSREFATRHVADAAEREGLTSAAAVQHQIAENAVPGVNSTLVNLDNGRLNRLAMDQAHKTRDQSLRPAAQGQPGEMMSDRLIREQRLEGPAQADALRGRLLDRAGFQGPARDASEASTAWKQQHDDLSTQLGQLTGNVDTPGLRDLLRQSPQARQAYNDARQLVQIPNAAGTMTRAPTARQVDDTNVPVQVLKEMRLSVGGMGNPANDRETQAAGSKLVARLEAIISNSSPPARRASSLISEKHDVHRMEEGLAAGRKVPKATPEQADEAVAAYRTAPAFEQHQQRFGYQHGIADAVDANRRNVGKLGDDFLGSEAQGRAHATLGAGGMPLEQVRTEIRNIGRMQDMAGAIRQTSRGRPEDSNTAVGEAARAYMRFDFTPAVGIASAVNSFLGGMTQPRRREILRQLTTPEGVDMLTAEFARRESIRGMPESAIRATIVNQLAQWGNERLHEGRGH